MSQAIPDRSLVGEIAMEYMDALYNTDLKPIHDTNGVKGMNGTNGHAMNGHAK